MMMNENSEECTIAHNAWQFNDAVVVSLGFAG
jgi:hypothetical protein